MWYCCSSLQNEYDLPLQRFFCARDHRIFYFQRKKKTQGSIEHSCCSLIQRTTISKSSTHGNTKSNRVLCACTCMHNKMLQLEYLIYILLVVHSCLFECRKKVKFWRTKELAKQEKVMSFEFTIVHVFRGNPSECSRKCQNHNQCLDDVLSIFKNVQSRCIHVQNRSCKK